MYLFLDINQSRRATVDDESRTRHQRRTAQEYPPSGGCDFPKPAKSEAGNRRTIGNVTVLLIELFTWYSRYTDGSAAIMPTGPALSLMVTPLSGGYYCRRQIQPPRFALQHYRNALAYWISQIR